MKPRVWVIPHYGVWYQDKLGPALCDGEYDTPREAKERAKQLRKKLLTSLPSDGSEGVKK